MNRSSILLFLVIAFAFSVPCMNAAENPSTAASGKKHKKTAKDDASAAPKFLELKQEGRLKRAYHLAEKGANTDFLNSKEGIGFKNQLDSVDQEVNATYEKNLNNFHENPEKGKMLREERDKLLQALFQKRKRIEAEYESLKKSSPVYRALYEKRLKSEMGQYNRKNKTQPSKDSEESGGTEDKQ